MIFSWFITISLAQNCRSTPPRRTISWQHLNDEVSSADLEIWWTLARRKQHVNDAARAENYATKCNQLPNDKSLSTRSPHEIHMAQLHDNHAQPDSHFCDDAALEHGMRVWNNGPPRPPSYCERVQGMGQPYKWRWPNPWDGRMPGHQGHQVLFRFSRLLPFVSNQMGKLRIDSPLAELQCVDSGSVLQRIKFCSETRLLCSPFWCEQYHRIILWCEDVGQTI